MKTGIQASRGMDWEAFRTKAVAANTLSDSQRWASYLDLAEYAIAKLRPGNREDAAKAMEIVEQVGGRRAQKTFREAIGVIASMAGGRYG